MDHGQIALDQLRAIKQKTEWSNERLAKEIDYHVNYVTRWLNGVKPRYGRREIAELYAKLFDEKRKAET